MRKRRTAAMLCLTACGDDDGGGGGEPALHEYPAAWLPKDHMHILRNIRAQTHDI